jgi:hypothetical protein
MGAGRGLAQMGVTMSADIRRRRQRLHYVATYGFMLCVIAMVVLIGQVGGHGVAHLLTDLSQGLVAP